MEDWLGRIQRQVSLVGGKNEGLDQSQPVFLLP